MFRIACPHLVEPYKPVVVSSHVQYLGVDLPCYVFIGSQHVVQCVGKVCKDYIYNRIVFD